MYMKIALPGERKEALGPTPASHGFPFRVGTSLSGVPCYQGGLSPSDINPGKDLPEHG
jgi:hypothetical protein